MQPHGFQPKVTFTLEIRSASSEQSEAGKRLFSRLINKAQADIQQQVTAKARAQAVAGAPPAVTNDLPSDLGNPPSLTNRGD